MVYLIIGFVIGSVFGGGCVMAVKNSRHKRSRVGKLRMDDSTGDTYLFLELDVPVDYVLNSKEITLDVDLSPITRE